MKRTYINGYSASSWPEWRKMVKMSGILMTYRRRKDVDPQHLALLAVDEGKLVWRNGHFDIP